MTKSKDGKGQKQERDDWLYEDQITSLMANKFSGQNQYDVYRYNSLDSEYSPVIEQQGGDNNRESVVVLDPVALQEDRFDPPVTAGELLERGIRESEFYSDANGRPRPTTYVMPVNIDTEAKAGSRGNHWAVGVFTVNNDGLRDANGRRDISVQYMDPMSALEEGEVGLNEPILGLQLAQNFNFEFNNDFNDRSFRQQDNDWMCADLAVENSFDIVMGNQLHGRYTDNQSRALRNDNLQVLDRMAQQERRGQPSSEQEARQDSNQRTGSRRQVSFAGEVEERSYNVEDEPSRVGLRSDDSPESQQSRTGQSTGESSGRPRPARQVSFDDEVGDLSQVSPGFRTGQTTGLQSDSEESTTRRSRTSRTGQSSAEEVGSKVDKTKWMTNTDLDLWLRKRLRDSKEVNAFNSDGQLIGSEVQEGKPSIVANQAVSINNIDKVFKRLHDKNISKDGVEKPSEYLIPVNVNVDGKPVPKGKEGDHWALVAIKEEPGKGNISFEYFDSANTSKNNPNVDLIRNKLSKNFNVTKAENKTKVGPGGRPQQPDPNSCGYIVVENAVARATGEELKTYNRAEIGQLRQDAKQDLKAEGRRSQATRKKKEPTLAELMEEMQSINTVTKSFEYLSEAKPVPEVTKAFREAFYKKENGKETGVLARMQDVMNNFSIETSGDAFYTMYNIVSNTIGMVFDILGAVKNNTEEYMKAKSDINRTLDSLYRYQGELTEKMSAKADKIEAKMAKDQRSEARAQENNKRKRFEVEDVDMSKNFSPPKAPRRSGNGQGKENSLPTPPQTKGAEGGFVDRLSSGGLKDVTNNNITVR